MGQGKGASIQQLTAELANFWPSLPMFMSAGMHCITGSLRDRSGKVGAPENGQEDPWVHSARQNSVHLLLLVACGNEQQTQQPAEVPE
jgi:hypothetical protein